jgi:hypothetical protein
MSSYALSLKKRQRASTAPDTEAVGKDGVAI